MSTALITGASGGIGLELACLMAADNYDLVLVARSGDKLNALASRIRQSHDVRVQVIAQDLGTPGGVQSLMEQVADEPIDILVNNAGCGDFGLFQDVDWPHYQQTLQLNMVALTELIHAVLPGMIKRGSGQIINIASTGAFQPLPWMAVYGATKAYVLSLSEALTFELRHTGVKVLALCPGATQSGFASAANADSSANFTDGKTVTPVDVAAFTLAQIRRQQSGVAIHGLVNRVRAHMAPMSPRAIVLRMAERTMRPK